MPLVRYRKLSQLLCLIALGLVAALGGGARAEELRVGIIGIFTDVPVFVADANGYFKDEGLSVQLVTFDSASQMIAPLGTGSLDAGGGAISVGLYHAGERGVEIKVVADKAHYAPGYGFTSLLVRKDLVDSGAFKSFSDLKDRKIALAGVGTTDQSAVNEALKRGGLKWGGAETVSLGFPQHLPALKNGAIDASITVEPARTFILKAGVAVNFADISSFYPNQQAAALLYGAPFIKNKTEAARKFMRAYLRGARFYNDALSGGHLDGPTASAVIDVLVKYSLLKDAALYHVITPNAVDPDGTLNVDSMQKDWQFFKDTGQIDGRVTVADIADTSFAAAAAASLGPYQPKKGD